MGPGSAFKAKFGGAHASFCYQSRNTLAHMGTDCDRTEVFRHSRKICVPTCNNKPAAEVLHSAHAQDSVRRRIAC